jgi:hypothetical protein
MQRPSGPLQVVGDNGDLPSFLKGACAMEPRQEKPKPPKPRPEEKPRRFRLLKLEARIAPKSPHGMGSGENFGSYSIQ